MKILIVGGKKFLGYHITRRAIEKGHEVTLFNRGLTYPDVLNEIPSIEGDRNTDLSGLEGCVFDVVIDTCAYYPKQVDKLMEVLNGSYDKYVLISTLSAIQLKDKGFDESVDIIGLDYDSEEITGHTYGPLKAACEKQVMTHTDKHLIIRPGYIVGDRDHTDRFTFWPVMMKHLDKMVVPKSDMMYAYIDVKDIADFVVRAVDEDLEGIYHLAGKAMSFSRFISRCHDLVNPDCELIEKPSSSFTEPPVYISYPQYDDIPEGHIMYSADVSKAFKAGLKQRPLEDTILDALKWFDTYKRDPKDLAAGMSYDDMLKMSNS